MARSVNHTPYNHWNVRTTRIRPAYWWRRGENINSDGLAEDERIISNVIYDLRYYAGCKRVPQLLAHRTPDWGGWPYTWGHGGLRGWRSWSNQFEGGLRTAARQYTRDAAKLHRAGEDLDELLEPEGRHRHQALWDRW
jgi:hypothetical protein